MAAPTNAAAAHEQRHAVDDLHNSRNKHRHENAVDAVVLESAPSADEQPAKHASNTAHRPEQRKSSLKSEAMCGPVWSEVKLDQ